MMHEYKKVDRCRICGSDDFYKFLDFGKMPLPNNFLKKEDFKSEKLYPMACLFCESCGLVQLDTVINPRLMFENYVYIPSASRGLLDDFYNLVYWSLKKVKTRQPFVVDIGSNDGSLLSFYKSFGAKVLGVDPARNLKDVALANGVETEVGFFDKKIAGKIQKKWGSADIICATNVVAHVDDLEGLLKAAYQLLAEDGFFICEFHYLSNLISGNEFDTIYHEHLSYFSLKPWYEMVRKIGFEIVDVQKIPIHGGSLRVAHSKNGRRSKNVDYLISLEEYQGLYKKDAYDTFAENILRIKGDLKTLLLDLIKYKKKIIGLGAPAKATVLSNFFDIGDETLEFICDSTPYKVGLYTPGKHIPIYAENMAFDVKPDYALILAWNWASEIMTKFRPLRKSGTKFIIPLPKVEVIT